MGKHLLILVLVIGMLTIVSAELEILGDDTDQVINLEGIIQSISSFLGLSDVLETTFATHGGECVVVNAGETGLVFGSCGGAGSGDITSVQGDEWITNGSNTGAVNLVFNASLLNDTIDARASSEISNASLNILYLNLSGTNANQDINISPFNLIVNNITLGNAIQDSANSIRTFFEGGTFVVEG